MALATAPSRHWTCTRPSARPNRTRTRPGMDSTGPDQGWTGTGPEAAGSRDQTRTSRSGGMPVRVTAAARRANEDSGTRPCLPLLRRGQTTGENRGAIAIGAIAIGAIAIGAIAIGAIAIGAIAIGAIAIGMAGANVVTAP